MYWQIFTTTCFCFGGLFSTFSIYNTIFSFLKIIHISLFGTVQTFESTFQIYILLCFNFSALTHPLVHNNQAVNFISKATNFNGSRLISFYPPIPCINLYPLNLTYNPITGGIKTDTRGNREFSSRGWVGGRSVKIYSSVKSGKNWYEWPLHFTTDKQSDWRTDIIDGWMAFFTFCKIIYI